MTEADPGKPQPSQSGPASAITVPPFPPPTIAREAAEDEQKSESASDRLAAKDKHKNEIQTRSLRERFSWVVSSLVLLWMIAIYALLIFQGTHHFFDRAFDLSDKIMLAALGTVTLNVIGLLVIILRFVFPSAMQNDGRQT